LRVFSDLYIEKKRVPASNTLKCSKNVLAIAEMIGRFVSGKLCGIEEIGARNIKQAVKGI